MPFFLARFDPVSRSPPTKMRCWQSVFVVVLLVATCSAMKIDLAQLLANARNSRHPSKRTDGDQYNPCPLLEKPWPCRNQKQCIPLNFVCDDNFDCEDWSDENSQMCTALNRPAVDDMKSFILKEKSWILPHILGIEPVDKIVHNLAVSATIDEFRRNVGLPREQFINLKRALKAIRDGDEATLQAMGMPPNAWDEVKFMFGKLIKSGFY